ncbi:MAG: hypothetical protein GC152_14815 [Alphaproteobacteria bacterium]|nr:hypothetical protein [Alphaproteobacteria bacterium]
MERISPAALAKYLQADPIGSASLSLPALNGKVLTSQRWLDEIPAKRLIFHRLYADFLSTESAGSLLDVGGGLSALTPALAAGRRYVLADPLHHESEAGLAAVRQAADAFDHRGGDWFDLDPDERFDVIVANDLFPNVDQRLGLFVEWAIPRARRILLSLTYHNAPRWYRVKRVDAEEHLTVLSVDGQRTAAMLAPHADRIDGWDPSLFDANPPSLFPNGRQVVLAEIRGDA